MKRLRKYIPILIAPVICILVGVGLCLFAGTDNAPEKIIYIENAAELYANAAKALKSGDLQLTITESANITLGNTTYSKNSNAVIRFDKSDPEDHRYHIQEELIMGTHRIACEDYYIAGEHYQIISCIPFREHVNIPEESVSKIMPSPALDHRLYKQITGIQTDDGYRIEFSEATAVENWVSAEQVQLESASGTAFLSTDGRLLSCSYTAAFEYDSIRYAVSRQLTPEPIDVEINLPDQDWVSITASAAPLLLEQSVGILVQADPISANYQEEIYFEALGDRRSRSINIRLDSADPLSAQIVTETTATNDSRLGQSDITVKTEKFADGKYTVLKDDAEETFGLTVDSEAMTVYLHNQLISTIMLPEFIEDCTVEDKVATVRYHFTGNAAFAEFLCRNAGQQLYGNPELLIGKDVTVETDHLTCYLELDSKTRLPLASGISYQASYQNEGLPYHFTYEATQTYQYSNQ